MVGTARTGGCIPRRSRKLWEAYAAAHAAGGAAAAYGAVLPALRAALLDDARLRWPKAVLDVRALRRATKVGVLPVAPKSAKRLNSKQKADERLCLRLLHRALSEQPWVYSTRSPAATHTAPRVCELADVAAAEAAAVVANDGVRRRGDVDDDGPDRGGDSYLYDHADPRMLWNAIPLKALVDAGAARCGTQPLVWGVPTKLQNSLSRSHLRQFG